MNEADGLTFRRPTVGDLEQVAAVFGAEERAVRGEVTMGVEEMRGWWPLFDLDTGSWLVEDEAGTVVGFSGLIVRGGSFDCWTVVHPHLSGRGVSTELLGRVEHTVRERGGKELQAGMLAGNDSARALLESRGFREVRRFYRMQIDFVDAPPEPVDVEGIRIARFEREFARAFHTALDEGFADEWGFVPKPYEEWERLRVDAPEADTTLWFIAWDGEEIAGVIRCDAEKYGGGFVGALAVRKPWRGRGIGMALLRRAFREFHDRGSPRVSLGVDAENASGATRLYERAGMRIVSEDVVFEKELT
jgi:mycothiol synthase